MMSGATLPSIVHGHCEVHGNSMSFMLLDYRPVEDTGYYRCAVCHALVLQKVVERSFKARKMQNAEMEAWKFLFWKSMAHESSESSDGNKEDKEAARKFAKTVAAEAWKAFDWVDELSESSDGNKEDNVPEDKEAARKRAKIAEAEAHA